MSFFGDLSSALYDLKHYAELSRRSAGRVAATFFLLAALIGIISGIWYVRTAGEFVGILAEEGKRHFPPIAIENGLLSSPVEQPYIVTERDLSPEFFRELESLVERRMHVSRGRFDIEALYNDLTAEEDKIFAFVLDTTETYDQVIDPEEYQLAVVLDRRAARVLGQAAEETEEQRYAALALPQPFALTPDRIDAGRAAALVRSNLGFVVPLVLVVAMAAGYAVSSTIIAALGLLIAIAARRPVEFGHAFRMAVYALAPVTVLNAVRVTMVAMPWIVPFLVHLAYVAAAVLLIPRSAPEPRAA